LWLAGAAGLYWLGPQLPLLERVILWTILLVGLVIVLRRFWSWLLGPLFFYDLVRTARRNRLIPIRCVYATALMVLLIYYGSMFASGFENGEDLLNPESLPPNRLAKVANAFYSIFILVQFIGVFALAPIFTAGAIVEEKEKRTYDLLLTTGLTNWEIVFGLLASRLANLGLVLLTGLPIICFLEFLGGIEPEAVFGNFILTGLLLLNLGCLSILTSAYAQSTLASILKVYLYSWLLWGCFLCLPIYGLILKPSAVGAIFEGWVLIGATSGFSSVLFLAIAVFQARQQGPSQAPDSIYRFALARRGATTFPETSHAANRQDDPDRQVTAPFNRPPVGDYPVMWKEMYLRGSRVMPSTAVIVFGCTVLGIVCLVIALIFSLPFGWNLVSLASTREVIQFLVILALGISLLPVAVAAARSVTEEREKKTLDSLAATPLNTKEILDAKWLGSIVGFRWPFLALAVFLLLTTFAGAIHPLAFPLLLIAWIFYALYFSSLGLYFSTISRTTLQATLLTGLAMITSVLGTFFDEGRNSGVPYIVVLLIRALSPAAIFRVLVFDLPFNYGDSAASFFFSLTLLCMVTPVLMILAWRRFKNTVRNGQ
jgi:ABC-type transport system involved in multi-copper enzyme maturation permease subunit